MYVDNLAYQIVHDASEFDVILAENLMGDILSDIGGALAGSLGMLGSSSKNENGFGLYEPVHGTAPDIEGKNLANPIGMFMAVSMMLADWNMDGVSSALTNSIDKVMTGKQLNSNLYSASSGGIIGTTQFTDLVIEEIKISVKKSVVINDEYK